VKRINRDKIARIWSLIIHRLGKSKYKKELPCLIFRPDEKYGGVFYGEYINYNNLIKIWWKSHTNSKDIILTMIHEYVHHLQYWPWYVRYMNKYKYDKNPYEIQAIEISELYEPEISKYSSDIEWEKILKKDPKLKKIYENVYDKIIINV
jgi:hypothetical protein